MKVLLVEEQRSEGERNVSEAVKEARKLLSQSIAENNSNEYEKSRELVHEAFLVMDREPGRRQGTAALDPMQQIGMHAYDIHEYETASNAFACLDQFLQETRPPDDLGLLKVQMYLGISLYSRYMYKETNTVLKDVHQILEQKCSSDDSLLQMARVNYGLTLKNIGDPLKGMESLDDYTHHFPLKENGSRLSNPRHAMPSPWLAQPSPLPWVNESSAPQER